MHVVWYVPKAPCCGAAAVHVYPIECREIECDCGGWIKTPRYSPHERRLARMNVLATWSDA